MTKVIEYDLCLGHGEIFYGGQQLVLDAKNKQNNMGAYAIYSYIHPDDEMDAEEFPEDFWIIENAGRLTSLFTKYGGTSMRAASPAG